MLYSENEIVKETIILTAETHKLTTGTLDAYLYVNNVAYNDMDTAALTIVESFNEKEYKNLTAATVSKIVEQRYDEVNNDPNIFGWVSCETVYAYADAQDIVFSLEEGLRKTVYNVCEEAEDKFEFQTETLNSKAEYAEYYFSEYLSDSKEIREVYGKAGKTIISYIKNGATVEQWEEIFNIHLDGEVYIHNGFVFAD